jgi:imidazolonepropionase-like amidohydrolase
MVLAVLMAWAVVQAQQTSLAFVDISLVPMDRPQVLEHQTVLVRNGRIAAIGESTSVRIPAEALQVDGRGKFLMPGLADMHVHFVREALPPNLESPRLSTGRRQPGIPASASADHDLENRAYALMFLANGVTTVRNMWGSKIIDEFASEIDAARVPGPHVYSTGPITDGNPPAWLSSRVVETPGQAEDAVRADKQSGRVAIKVYSLLSPDSYDAIVNAARRQGLPVVGHVPTGVGLEKAIAAHQDSIEHLDAFLRYVAPNAKSPAEALQQADLNRLPAIVQAIRTANVWICPTVVVADEPRTDPVWLEHASFVPPNVFVRYNIMYPNRGSDPRATPQARKIFLAVVAALHNGGVHLLLGTDTVKAGTLPGYSLHDELENFAAAGMTPYEAIRAGTVDAAQFLHQESEFGVVRVGLRADLLVVDASPLADVTNVSKITGVVAGGHWFPTAELNRRLVAHRATYKR